MKNAGVVVFVAVLAAAAGYGLRPHPLVRADDSAIPATPTGCDAKTLSSPFGLSVQGYTYDRNFNTIYIAATGLLTGDGSGNLSGTETLSYDGTIVRGKLSGTYDLSAECTGSATIVYADGTNTLTNHFDIVAVNNGKEFAGTGTDNLFILTATLKRVNQ